MLDPISALGLAGNIAQFIEFGNKLISGSLEMYNSTEGASSNNVKLQSIVTNLQSIANDLTAANGNELPYPEKDAALMDIVSQCQNLAEKLLGVLQDLTVRDGKHKRWKTVLQALRSVWKEREIDDMKKRLSMFQSQLTLRLVAILGDQQSSVNTGIDNLSRTYESLNTNSGSMLTILKDILSIVPENDKTKQASISILDSLHFETIRARHDNIIEAHAKTFDWILKGAPPRETEDPDYALPQVKLLEWLHSQGGLYWIIGKAGCGKSTMMKFLNNNENVKSALGVWAGQTPLFIGSYFFWSSGTELQKSKEGLLRSLLYDILCQLPALMPIVVPGRWDEAVRNYPGPRKSISSTPWSLQELREAFCELSKQDAIPAKFCFFVDGLDEHNGDPVEIVDTLKGFALSSDIKVCLSSRPWTELEYALKGDPNRRLMLQYFTKGDIQRYVHDLLEKHPRFQEANASDYRFKALISEIVAKSKGVFLWVFFVVRSLLRGLKFEDTISDLQNRLRNIPSELNKYFEQMLETIDDVYRGQTAAILHMCLADTEPLPLMTFSFLDEKDPDYAIRHILPLTDEQIMSRCEVVAKRVKARCRDFLDIVGIHYPRVSSQPRSLLFCVEFLHRTTRDFCLTRSVQDKLNGWTEPKFDADLSLCRAYLAQMKITPLLRISKIINTNDFDFDEINHRAFLTDFAYPFLHHARQVELRTKSPEDVLIEDLDRTLLIRLHDANRYNLQEFIGHPAYTKGDVLMLAVKSGLKHYVCQKLQNEPYLIEGINGTPILEGIFGHPLYGKGLKGFNFEMLQLLLDRNADPNQKSLETTSWRRFLDLMYHSRINDTEDDTRVLWPKIIQLFLERGAYNETRIFTGISGEYSPCYKSVAEIIDECCPKDAAHLKRLLEGNESAKFESGKA